MIAGKGRKGAALFLFAAVLSGAAGAILFLPLAPVLCARPRTRPGPVLILEDLSAGMREVEFVISYTHSVNKGRVSDFCRLGSGGSIDIYKTRFVSYGAGMPEPEDGSRFRSGDGWLELDNLGVTVPRIVLALGASADHRIDCGGRTFVLKDVWPVQTSIAIEVRKISLYSLIVKQYLRKQ